VWLRRLLQRQAAALARSRLDRLGDGECVIHIDAGITVGAFEPGMPEELLDSSKFARL